MTEVFSTVDTASLLLCESSFAAEMFTEVFLAELFVLLTLSSLEATTYWLSPLGRVTLTNLIFGKIPLLEEQVEVGDELCRGDTLFVTEHPLHLATF